MMKAICTWLLALAICVLAGAGISGPDDTQAAQDMADELAMREACGENSGHYRLEDGRIQCLTKRGKKVSIK